MADSFWKRRPLLVAVVRNTDRVASDVRDLRRVIEGEGT